MTFSAKELELLWNLIKDKRNIFAGKYEGLMNVRFDLSISLFEKRNVENHRESSNIEKAIIPADFNETIKTLYSADIRCHHLSCAAESGLGKNAALCIHYSKDNAFQAITIPGVNYIPTKETLQMLAKRYPIPKALSYKLR